MLTKDYAVLLQRRVTVVAGVSKPLGDSEEVK